MNTTTIVLATSAVRPEYRRDFLTCIASPTGHQVSFMYKVHWWQKQLLHDAARLDKRPALIVFCEESAPSAEFEFLPLRHAVIKTVEPSEVIEHGNISEDTAITITFQLGPLVYATDRELHTLKQEWNSWLIRSPNRPRPSGHHEHSESCFVFEHDHFPDQGQTDERGAWSTLSSTLADCASMRGAYFFRVASFIEQGSPTKQSIAPRSERGLPAVYPLETNTQYLLTLDTYSKSGETPVADVVEPVTSSNKLSVQSTQPPSAGRSPTLLVLLDTAAVSWPQIATLTLRGSKDHEHYTPRVDFVTSIAPRTGNVVFLMCVLAIGAVLTGVSKDDFSLPLWAVYLLKAIGGLIVAVAGFRAIRRAPGLGK